MNNPGLHPSRTRTVLLAALAAATLLPGGGQVAAEQHIREVKQLSVASSGESGWIRHDTDKWSVIPEWPAAPQLDGSLQETAWGSAAQLGGFTTAYYGYPEQEATFRLGYNGQNLYVGGSWPAETANKLAGVEVVLRAPGGGEEHFTAHIPLRPAPSLGWETYWNPPRNVSSVDLFTNAGRTDIGPIDYTVTETSGTVVMEAAIPLGELAPNGITSGEEWQLNVIQVPNLYAYPLSSWTPIRYSEHWHGQDSQASVRLYASVVDQDRLGRVFFGQIPAEAGPAPASGSYAWERWALTETKLKYEGFTAKRLVLEQEATEPVIQSVYGEWKSPNGQRQPLADWTLTGAGPGRWEAAFTHPEPLEDGQYELVLQAVPASGVEARLAVLTFDREDLIRGGLETIEAVVDEENPIIVAWAEASEQVEGILELIPEQPGFRFTGLPEMPELRPDGLYQLSADGSSLIAKQTSTVYPNAQFEEDKDWVVKNKRGETISIPYYQDASGKRYFITAHLWYLQKKKALEQTEALAVTDPLGAARLLYRFSQLYEGYNPTVDYPFVNRSVDSAAGPPYAYWGGVWERGWYNDLINLRHLVNAYSEIKHTNAFELLSGEVGEDVEAKFVDTVVKPSADYVFSYVHRDSNLNAQTWQGLVALGKALGDPDYIHRVIEQMNRFMARAFLADGFWNEVTLSYHAQIMNGLTAVIDQLQGWSDPSGYISPRTGQHLDNVDGETQFPAIDKAMDLLDRLIYPDGKYVPIMDTWASGRSTSPAAELDSMLLPDARIGRLSGGTGSDQTQLYLYFQPKFGHEHYDGLHLGLYANKQELLPDIGYTNTKYRIFSRSTLAHNTVVVDSESMLNDETARRGGNVEAFVPDGGMFQAMRAEYESAYAQTETYSREPWFVPFADGDGSQGYVLDLFRVAGGSRHEYTLQGDANRDAWFRTDMPLQNYGPALAADGLYSHIRDVEQAQLAGDRYEVTLVTDNGVQELAKTRLIGLLEDGRNELYLGRAPSLRATRLQGSSMDNNIEADNYTMPKLLLRRDGTDLRSTFVTLMEPYGADQSSRIEAIDRLELDEGPEGAVAVQVIYGDTTDIFLSNPNDAAQALILGDITFYGRLGMIRLVEGEVREMALGGGTLLRKGQREVTGPGAAYGTVMGTKSKLRGDAYDAIVTNAAVPASAVGRYMIVRHPDGSTNGYEIGEVRQEQGETLLLLAEHDPGFELRADGSSAQTAYPGIRWSGGDHTFAVDNLEQASWNAPEGAQPPLGTVTGTVYGLDHNPVVGALVNPAGYPSIQTYTDNEGQFVLTQVPAGKRWIKAFKAGYEFAVPEAVYVSTGTSSVGEIRLSRRSPLLLTDATQIGVSTGEPVGATSSADGTLYLVPATTEPTRGAIEQAGAAASGRQVAVMGGVPAVVDTTGLPDGLYTLYAIDFEGAVSSGAGPLAVIGTQPAPDTIDSDSPLVMYTGSWMSVANAQNYGGGSRQARDKDAYVDIAFYGKRATLYSLVGTARGIAAVYVDGELVGELDTVNPSVKYQHPILDTGLLSEGVHLIRLVVTGRKSQSSTNFFINFDVLRVTE